MIDMSMPADGYLVDRLTNEVICGYCNIAKASDEHDLVCSLIDDIEAQVITWDDVLTDYPDYYADSTPIIEESFIESTSITKADEWAGIFANRERDFIGNYRDLEPNRCTHAIAWSHNGRSGNYPETDGHMPKPMRIKGQTRKIEFTETSSYEQSYDGLDYEDRRLANLTFNELQGFASQRLIDHDVTERYQYHFFNAFWGRDNNFHIGSITFTRTIDDRVQAQCSKCSARLVSAHEATKDDMIAFTSAAIRHGNNHGPSWLTRRNDFTFIHANNCDTNHDHNSPCNGNVERYTVDALATESEAFHFLMHHRRFCTDSNCRCTHYYHLLSERDREFTNA